jgi:carboxymethylenebutenolidase
MIVSADLTIDVAGHAMPAYLARPSTGEPRPAVIVLEGVCGFDAELRRITDLLASTGYVGLAINYFYRTNPRFEEPFTPEGRARGQEAARSVTREDARGDVAAARDWLNEQAFVERGHVGTWGFGFGGTVAFVAATLPGLGATISFYGQSIASPLPSGEPAPLEDAKDVRAPLLLVFGGKDELIGATEVERIEASLSSFHKSFEVQRYPNVGHSFFRANVESTALREAADAWDRVQAFLHRHLD